MGLVHQFFNVALVIMIVSTMVTAGLGITLDELSTTFRQIRLVALVLVANLLVVPLIGWGIAALFSLSTSAYIALILIASSPGGPFGAKLAMMQRGEVVAGAGMQVLLALIGSVTFAVTANWILETANVGGGISLPVANLIKTVVLLQVVPFLVGLSIRQWSSERAGKWRPYTLKTSTAALLLVLASAILGNGQQIAELFGSTTVLAVLLYSAGVIATGALMVIGTMETRTTLALVTQMRSTGPAFAAIVIAFNDNPSILGAATAIALVELAIAVPLAVYLGRSRQSRERIGPVAVPPLEFGHPR